MKQIKVAVYGSCATRDNFNTLFNPDYKNFYTCVLTYSQTSLISAMSKPLAYGEEMLEGATNNRYEIDQVRMDWEKKLFSDLKKAQPDYIIMDFFADAHFGCIQLQDGQYITNNRWQLWDTKLYKDLKANNRLKKLTLNDHFDAYMQKWKKAADQFMAFMKEELPNTRVIIHKARNSNDYLDKGNLYFNQTHQAKKQHKWFDPEKNNRQWEQMDDYLIENYDVDVIDLKNKRYPAFRQHKWGFFYLHYVYQYYRDFLLHLNLLMLKNGNLNSQDAIAELVSHIERLEFEAGSFQRDYYEKLQQEKHESEKQESKKTLIKKLLVG